MAIKEFMAELQKLTPEERAQLSQILSPQPAAAPLPAGRERQPPEAVKAQAVFFFRQLHVVHVDEAKMQADGKTIKKVVTQLPPRVIAVDEKMAWRLYWKQRGKYQFLGRGSGQAWRAARLDGKTVSEAQAAEYEAMLAAPDMTPPMNREKTFFAGTKPSIVAQGREISWAAGINQGKPE